MKILRRSLRQFNSFVTAPLDIVKIRLQLQVTSRSTRSSTPSVLEPTYKGAVQTFKSILQGEGVTVRVI